MKVYSNKNGEENARNTTERSKDKRMDQTKHKSVGCGRRDGKAEMKMGWPLGVDELGRQLGGGPEQLTEIQKDRE